MKHIHGNIYQGYRKDGCLITLQGVPQGSGKRVWQVNHGPSYSRQRKWFETRREALFFAKNDAVFTNEWDDIYIVNYPNKGALRDGSKLLGHKNAECLVDIYSILR